ncbi:MAG: pseudouridine synthase [Pseudomonadota bacterium]
MSPSRSKYAPPRSKPARLSNHGGKRRGKPAAAETPVSAPEKLQKVLAATGLGSRREIEGWIGQGRILVNGDPAHIGQRVTNRDRIEVDGARVSIARQGTPQVLILNKLAGTVCSRHDEEGRKTVFDTLPRLRSGRWIGVGRLDMQTTGLLVLTSDGALANRMMHPSTGLDREYAVRVNKRLEEAELQQLLAGIDVEGEQLRFSDIRFYDGSEKNFWYHVVLLEGKNREVRRLFEAVGCVVSRLKRVRYGPLILPSWLRAGQWAKLQEADVSSLYQLLGLPYTAPANAGKRDTKSRGRGSEAKTSVLLPYPELP